MNYIEIKIVFSEAEPWKDIFTSLLGDAGCDSFMDGEDENILLCYIKQDLYNENTIREILENHSFDVTLHFTTQLIQEQNWNAVWESNFTPVFITDHCYVRAPFHEPRHDIRYEIVIEPKMSFGTAHHETTALMIEFLLEENLREKSVLDMGSGTGILAILAHQKGATPITAIDNDKWAYENNIENNERNQTTDIEVKLGDATAIGDRMFEVIIANINRNILLNDMPFYVKSLKSGGIIFFSGFYAGYDLEAIRAKAESLGLIFQCYKEKNNWVAAKFVKA
ncbi:MAG TPA: 50S ribosomal protein L11 methyltransferase [Bacteroidales bacterium]|nr:50S ribosomal protein L11 methyltransferase [Bacteroidales bacterium]